MAKAKCKAWNSQAVRFSNLASFPFPQEAKKDHATRSQNPSKLPPSFHVMAGQRDFHSQGNNPSGLVIRLVLFLWLDSARTVSNSYLLPLSSELSSSSLTSSTCHQPQRPEIMPFWRVEQASPILRPLTAQVVGLFVSRGVRPLSYSWRAVMMCHWRSWSANTQQQHMQRLNCLQSHGFAKRLGSQSSENSICWWE